MRLKLAAVLLVASVSTTQAAEPSIYAGVGGAKLIDSGAMIVTGGGPFDRTEVFEYLQRPDGGFVLLNTITAANGAYRVQARFDLDSAWKSLSAFGIGLYDGKPVDLSMRVEGKQVKIEVRPRDVSQGGVSSDPVATCDPSCFVNMSPSITAMFVMTRHYDFAKGGEQEFLWAGQDLDRVRTLSGGKARLQYRGEKEAARAGGAALKMRHFTFVETLPNPAGGTYSLDFDLWTDGDHRPVGFRIRFSGGNPSGVVGWRQGWENVRAALIAP